MTSPRIALVTGAGGFIGANLTRRLVGLGHAVHTVVRPGSEPWRLRDVAGDVRPLEVDLRDADAVRAALTSVGPEWIFHLAAHGAYSWQSDVRPIFDTNAIGTVNVVEAALERGFAAFVHAGSSSEYGVVGHAPNEDERIDPNSHYAVAKAAATMYCRHSARASDAHIVTLRLYSVYGPWEDPRRLIPRLLVLGRRGRLPPLADPDTARDFVYVDDVVDAFVRIAEHDSVERGCVLNVGTGRQTTLREVVGTARSVLGISAEPEWRSGHIRSWDTNTWVADSSRIQDEIGWVPLTTLPDGILATAQWLEGSPQLAAMYESAP